MWASPSAQEEAELQAILAAKEEKLRLKVQRQDAQAQNMQHKQQEAHRCMGGSHGDSPGLCLGLTLATAGRRACPA